MHYVVCHSLINQEAKTFLLFLDGFFFLFLVRPAQKKKYMLLEGYDIGWLVTVPRCVFDNHI
jgi:hypothetical protein